MTKLSPESGPVAVVHSPPPPVEPPRPQEGFSEIIDAIGRNKDAGVAFIHAIGEEFHAASKTRATTHKQMSWLFFAFMALIVVSCGFLVFFGRMTDGALTFLLGVIVGYMMRFVDRLEFGGRGEDEA